MGKNDKPTDSQGSNKPSTPATVPSSAKRPARDVNKGTQNARKASSSTSNANNIPERPKKASGSGSNPPAKPQARSTKLGAFQPCKGVPSDEVGAEEQWVPYDPKSREFILLADAYNLGMRLLERPDSTAKLIELGRRCIRNWKSEAPMTGYHWSGDENKITEYVRHFLEKYRNETTRINVSARPLGDAYAESEYDIGYVLPDFFKLDPKALTTVVLDSELFTKVVQNDARRIQLFGSEAQKNVTNMRAFAQARKECTDLSLIYQAMLGSIMFHEFAHCFVYYLGMTGEPNTPASVTILDKPSTRGESGSWLEFEILGGDLAIKEDVLYFLDEHRQGREVDLARLKDLVSKTEAFDLRNGIPLKAQGRESRFHNRQKSEGMVPDTRQRAIFKSCKKRSRAYDVYLGRDSEGFPVYTAAPQVVEIAA